MYNFLCNLVFLNFVLFVLTEFDTDDETDVLLGKQYQKDEYVDIPELSQPPINRSAQVLSYLPVHTIPK